MRRNWLAALLSLLGSIAKTRRWNKRSLEALLSLVVAIWPKKMERRQWLLAGLGLLAMAGCVACFWSAWRSLHSAVAVATSGEATIEFLDVGQGDSALVTSPEGKTALIDAGPSNRVVELLHQRAIQQLDLVVISHHHLDHYGGMKEVIRQFHPRVFLDADSPHVTPTYLSLLKLVKDEGMTAIRAGPESRTVELGSVTLKIFPTAPIDSNDENNNSVGIRLVYGSFSALFPGDAEGAERRWWMAQLPELCEPVDVLKLAHHGSRNGTDSRWLDLTRPSLAVASLGAGNSFGHPHRETLALLKARGIRIERTDQSGSILVRTDGRTWSVEAGRQAVEVE